MSNHVISEPIKPNPFAAKKRPAGASRPVETAKTSTPVNEKAREQIRTQLEEAINPPRDSIDNSLVKIGVKEIAEFIEKKIYEYSDNDCKSKTYRERSRFFIARFKGTKNNSVRNAIKYGELNLEELCSLEEKVFY